MFRDQLHFTSELNEDQLMDLIYVYPQINFKQKPLLKNNNQEYNLYFTLEEGVDRSFFINYLKKNQIDLIS